MSYETTLAAVRRISEQAVNHPIPRRRPIAAYVVPTAKAAPISLEEVTMPRVTSGLSAHQSLGRIAKLQPPAMPRQFNTLNANWTNR